ncbi:coiled-coil domain-containing protein [Desulfovibrio piger]|uniref:coiled-coil domain-containing protein n=1 Tax=Desulfovibrio piger TaxID=901 RepID=UPI0039927741
MLVFRTISPLAPSATLQQLIDISIEWIDKSPEYHLRGSLAAYYGQEEFSVEKEGEQFRSFRHTKEDSEFACICFQKTKGDEKWRTECVYKKTAEEVIASFSVYCETASFQNKLNNVKKPYIFKLIGQRIGFGHDIEFETRSTPHPLTADDLDIAASIIKGEFVAHLPCVYVSKGRDGNYPVDITKLCHVLSGMAHVFIEPNIYFMRDLRIRTEGLNPYYGAVGIYFPGSRNKKLLLPQWEDGNPLKIRNIFDAVKNGLNLGYIPGDLSYVDIRTDALRKKVVEAQEQNDLQSLIDSVDKENKSLNENLERKEGEIYALKEYIASLESRLNDNRERVLLRGDSVDSYRNQTYETLLDILEDARRSAEDGTRRKNIINELLEANPRTDNKENLARELKRIFSGYTSMNNSIKSSLRRLGFQVDDSKHHKIFFTNYPELASTLPTSGSDYRGWQNDLSDLKKKLL